MFTRTHVGIALATLASLLALSSGVAAQRASRRAAARCPRNRPSPGAACSPEARACPYACSAEDDRDSVCTCVRGDDDELRWACVEGSVCLH